jgi:hypothetical protein
LVEVYAACSDQTKGLGSRTKSQLGERSGEASSLDFCARAHAISWETLSDASDLLAVHDIKNASFVKKIHPASSPDMIFSA